MVYCLPFINVLLITSGNSFSDDERCVAAGYDNGDLKMFDLRTLSLHWETHIPNGVRAIRSISSTHSTIADLQRAI